MLSRPPTKEVRIPTPNALPASPLSAMGPPSNTVAIEEAVPGILSRIAEINPPEIPPIYRPTNSEIPFIGSMPNDIGKNKIIAMEADRPGIEPNTIPTITPAKIKLIQTGFSNTI